MRAAWGLLGLAIVGLGCNTKKKAGGFAGVPQQVPMAVEVYDAREDFPPCVTLLHGTAYTARDTGARYECNAQQQDWVLLEGSGRMTVRQVDEETVNRARTAAEAAEEHKNTADEAAEKAELKEKESALRAAESALSAATSVEARTKAEEEVILAKAEVEKARKKVEETKTSEEKAKDHLDAAVIAKDAAKAEKSEAVKAKDEAKVEKVAAEAAKDEAKKQKEEVVFLAKNNGVVKELTVPAFGSALYDAENEADAANFVKAVEAIDVNGKSAKAEVFVYDPREYPAASALTRNPRAMLAAEFKQSFFATQTLGDSNHQSPRLVAVGQNYYFLEQNEKGTLKLIKYDSFFHEIEKATTKEEFSLGEVHWALKENNIYILGLIPGVSHADPAQAVFPKMVTYTLDTTTTPLRLLKTEFDMKGFINKGLGLRAATYLTAHNDAAKMSPQLLDMAVTSMAIPKVIALVKIGGYTYFLSPLQGAREAWDTDWSYTSHFANDVQGDACLHLESQPPTGVKATGYYIANGVLKKMRIQFDGVGKPSRWKNEDLTDMNAGTSFPDNLGHTWTRLQCTKTSDTLYLNVTTTEGKLHSGQLKNSNFEWKFFKIEQGNTAMVVSSVYNHLTRTALAHLGADGPGGLFFRPEAENIFFWNPASWGVAQFDTYPSKNLDRNGPTARSLDIQIVQSADSKVSFATMVWSNELETQMFLRRLPLTQEMLDGQVRVDHPNPLVWKIHNTYPFALHVKLQLAPKQ